MHANPPTSANMMPKSRSRNRLKPPLKWVGGKRWQISHLEHRWRPYSRCRLVEPFCGGLAVALGLGPDRALLNDINPHLISFYRWLQRGLSNCVPRRNKAELYYSHRARFNELTAIGCSDTEEAAALFYFLNRTGFNGLCRFNRKGEFNVPFGKFKTIPYIGDFSEYREALKDWEFVASDFEELALDEDDFVYADPPYDVDFTRYSSNGFGWRDQKRLVEWLARHPGPVILVNQGTDRIIELYRQHGYELSFLEAPRSVSCNGNRRPVREVLAMRNLKE